MKADPCGKQRPTARSGIGPGHSQSNCPSGLPPFLL